VWRAAVAVLWAQVVSSELAAVAAAREAASEEARRLGARLASAEQLLRAREAEGEDLRRVYEALAADHRRWGWRGGRGLGLQPCATAGHAGGRSAW
jgi:hypothetical protein